VDLSGVHVPLVTPFDTVTGEVDPVALRANVRALLAHDVRSVVVAGSTGEAVLLDEAERRLLIEAARAVVTGDRLLLAGVGAESTRATLRIARAAVDAGADAVLVMPPAFFRGFMTPEALRAHYAAVADGAGVPVVVYAVPPHFSTVDLTAGLIAELARHGNVVGIKDSRASLEQVGELLRACPAEFQLLSGSGAHFYGALEMGARGGVLGVSHLAPGAAVALYRSFREGRPAEAGRLQERIGPLHKEIVVRFAAPGIKVALDLLGQRGGPPRPPLLPLPAKQRDEVKETLQRAGLLQIDRPAMAG
jgi:4-hydroxy-2-oxoglutarate aldolase